MEYEEGDGGEDGGEDSEEWSYMGEKIIASGLSSARENKSLMEGEAEKSDAEEEDGGWMKVGQRQGKRGGWKDRVRGKGGMRGRGGMDEEGEWKGRRVAQRSEDGDGTGKARIPPTLLPRRSGGISGRGGGGGRRWGKRRDLAAPLGLSLWRGRGPNRGREGT